MRHLHCLLHPFFQSKWISLFSTLFECFTIGRVWISSYFLLSFTIMISLAWSYCTTNLSNVFYVSNLSLHYWKLFKSLDDLRINFPSVKFHAFITKCTKKVLSSSTILDLCITCNMLANYTPCRTPWRKSYKYAHSN